MHHSMHWRLALIWRTLLLALLWVSTSTQARTAPSYMALPQHDGSRVHGRALQDVGSLPGARLQVTTAQQMLDAVDGALDGTQLYFHIPAFSSISFMTLQPLKVREGMLVDITCENASAYINFDTGESYMSQMTNSTLNLQKCTVGAMPVRPVVPVNTRPLTGLDMLNGSHWSCTDCVVQTICDILTDDAWALIESGLGVIQPDAVVEWYRISDTQYFTPQFDFMPFVFEPTSTARHTYYNCSWVCPADEDGHLQAVASEDEFWATMQKFSATVQELAEVVTRTNSSIENLSLFFHRPEFVAILGTAQQEPLTLAQERWAGADLPLIAARSLVLHGPTHAMEIEHDHTTGRLVERSEYALTKDTAAPVLDFDRKRDVWRSSSLFQAAASSAYPLQIQLLHLVNLPLGDTSKARGNVWWSWPMFTSMMWFVNTQLHRPERLLLLQDVVAWVECEEVKALHDIAQEYLARQQDYSEGEDGEEGEGVYIERPESSMQHREIGPETMVYDKFVTPFFEAQHFTVTCKGQHEGLLKPLQVQRDFAEAIPTAAIGGDELAVEASSSSALPTWAVALICTIAGVLVSIMIVLCLRRWHSTRKAGSIPTIVHDMPARRKKRSSLGGSEKAKTRSTEALQPQYAPTSTSSGSGIDFVGGRRSSATPLTPLQGSSSGDNAFRSFEEGGLAEAPAHIVNLGAQAAPKQAALELSSQPRRDSGRDATVNVVAPVRGASTGGPDLLPEDASWISGKQSSDAQPGADLQDGNWAHSPVGLDDGGPHSVDSAGGRPSTMPLRSCARKTRLLSTSWSENELFSEQHLLDSACSMLLSQEIDVNKHLYKGLFCEFFEGEHRGGKVTITSIPLPFDKNDIEYVLKTMPEDTCPEHPHIQHALVYSVGRLTIKAHGAQDWNLNVTRAHIPGGQCLESLIRSGSLAALDGHTRMVCALNILLNIASALEAAHDNGCMHGSLSPWTVFLTTTCGDLRKQQSSLVDLLVRARVSAKVVDFGLLPHMVQHCVKNKQALPAFISYHAAPEARSAFRFHSTGDVYSFGVIMWELATGCSVHVPHSIPESHSRSLEAKLLCSMGETHLQRSLDMHPDFPTIHNSHLPAGVVLRYASLMQACLQERMEQRPALKNINADLAEIRDAALMHVHA